jgi:serine/threonine-protein kinase HipA
MELSVIFNGADVGVLTQKPNGRISFRYNNAWLDAVEARPLSQSLPLRPDSFNERECAPFFGGLLPEEVNREQLARNIGISPRNDFAMLQAIGGECAGAISFKSEAEQADYPETRYLAISEAELISLLEQLPQRPLLAGKAEIRLSLAGAQDKIALFKDAAGFALPLNTSPSTHILKPESVRFPGLAENEAYCLRLATDIGLPACTCELCTFGPHRCLLVSRYDRSLINGAIERLHQEDFCQALAIPSRIKYQSEGGPGLAACFELIRKVSASPAKDLLHLFNVVIYNYIIGNHDAHAKNFSLLYSSQDEAYAVRLAPFYDLISTAIYPQLTSRMAMKVGAQYQPNDIRCRDWERLWQSIGFSQKQAVKHTLAFVDTIQSAIRDPQSEVEQAIQGIIINRSNALRKHLV